MDTAVFTVVSTKSGKTYYLQEKTWVESGKKRSLYVLAATRGENCRASIPADYEVRETRTGIPYLRKQQGV